MSVHYSDSVITPKGAVLWVFISGGSASSGEWEWCGEQWGQQMEFSVFLGQMAQVKITAVFSRNKYSCDSVPPRLVACLPTPALRPPLPSTCPGQSFSVCAWKVWKPYLYLRKVNVCCLSVNALALGFRLAFVLLLRNNTWLAGPMGLWWNLSFVED